MTPALHRWWQRRSRRERWAAGLAVIVTLVVVLDSLFFAAQRQQARALDAELVAGKKELAQLQQLVAQHAQAGDARMQARIEALTQRRARAEDVIRSAQTDLVAPHQMPAQLARILDRHPRVRVVAANSVAPLPVLAGEVAGKSAAIAGLFQHGMEVQVEARYLDLLDWLDALEQSPHRMYWRELELKIGPQGVPLTRIAFFTLSREAAWLKL